MTTNGAEIQIEKGEYTRIHNVILEKLGQYNFTSQEYACILHLLRMTYGFRRKEYKLSYSDFQVATGIDPANVSRTMRRLTDNKVVIRSETGPNTAATWSFNKYFEQWTVKSRVKTTTVQDAISCQIDNSLEDNSCQNDNTAIVESTRDLLSNQQELPCQIDNSYISAKESIKEKKESSKDAAAAAVFDLWKNNMRGTFTTIIADDLGDLIDTYGADTVTQAITEAVRCEGRTVRYVSRILENWASGKSRPPEKMSPPTTVSGRVAGFSLASLMEN
jgi:phage replication O-like protein O